MALTAMLVLAGWLLNVDLLTRVITGSVAMNPMTAVSFILICVALWLSLQTDRGDAPGKPGGRIATACAGAVSLVGLVRLAGYVLGSEVGIDRLLFASRLGSAGDELANRMAPNTAFNFLLLGAVIILFRARRRPWWWLAQTSALTVVLNAFLAFVGHTVGAPALFQPLPFIGMAVNTAFCFVILGLGTLGVRPDLGVAAIVSSPDSGGIMARRLLPAAILVPLAIGWLRLWGQRAGLYGTVVGLGMMMTACVVLLTLFALMTSADLNRMDAQRRRAVEATRLSEQRLAHALDLAESAIISVDENQRIEYFDERSERLFGFTRQEILGQPLGILLPSRLVEAHRRHVEDFGALPEVSRRMAERREVFGKRKDGSEFPAEAAISRSVRDGRVVFTAVMRDVTERKKTEEEGRRAARLEAANRELESFSYSVAHDLRAPLRHIDGFIDLLVKRASHALDEQSRNHLSTITESARRMGALIDDLLAFSRTARAEMRTARVRLGPVLEEVLKDLESEFTGREIEWRRTELPEVECDPSLMRIVLANLVGNALKFTRTRGKTVIEIGVMNHSPGRIVVFVRDNGIGFDMRYKDKLFGVFQRLHRQEEFEGTGIGLATVRRIVERHGGETWAEAEPDKGATFYFSLPAPGTEVNR